MRKDIMHIFSCAGLYAALKVTVRIDKSRRSFERGVLSGRNAAFRAPISGALFSYRMFLQLWSYCRTIGSYSGQKFSGFEDKHMLLMKVH
jgi:hypothetical protein